METLVKIHSRKLRTKIDLILRLFLSETDSVRTIISYNFKILLKIIILNEIKNVLCDVTLSCLVNH
jgi:hypothetical protein